MAYLFRNSFPEAKHVVAVLQSQALAIGASTAYHVDKGAVGTGVANGSGSTTITAANASDLPTLVTLTRQIVAKTAQHAASTVAHKVVDETFVTTVASVVDLASAIVALNAIKALINTHIASTTYHYNADSTNGIAATDATTQGTAQTLANEIKTDFTAHVTSGNVANVPILMAF
jgi:hypothetical protein